jgi:LacI family transcriptional regulator
LQVGRAAAERLFAGIKGDDRPGERIVLPIGALVRATIG